MQYIPHLHATKLNDGGYILHGVNSIETDYVRYSYASGRIDIVATLLIDTGWKAYLPYKYENWLGLNFPLLPHYSNYPKLPIMYEEVDDEIKQAVVIAERHLFCDRIFENWLPANGTNLHEWDYLSASEQYGFIYGFKLVTNIDYL